MDTTTTRSMASANFSVYLPVSKEFHQRRCFLRPFYTRVDISLEMRILFSTKFSEYSEKFIRILKMHLKRIRVRIDRFPNNSKKNMTNNNFKNINIYII